MSPCNWYHFWHLRSSGSSKSPTTLHVLKQVDPPEGVAPPDVPQRLELAPALGQVLRVHHVVRRLRARLLRLGQVGAQILKIF